MAEHVPCWLALSSFIVATAACTEDPGVERAQALDAGRIASALAAPSAELTPVYLQFDAEKARATIVDLPEQF